MISTSAKWVFTLLFLATSLSTKVRVVIRKQRYQGQDQIPARLENQHTTQAASLAEQSVLESSIPCFQTVLDFRHGSEP